MDDGDGAENPASPEAQNKQSRRDRFKGALARTKSKFKKENDKTQSTDLPDDVNDFLAAGRPSTLNKVAPPPIDTRQQQHHTISPAHEDQSNSASSASPRPSTSDSISHSLVSQRSPKRIPIPKIDVSTAQRWPRAQPVGTHDEDINDFLRPEYQVRSRSASSLSNFEAKQKRRNRGLSVSFMEAPPVIIGEGGDNAPTPPAEIGRARQRARSVSPIPTRAPPPEPSMNGTYGKRPSPIPPPRQTHALPDVLRPRALQRIQTGGFSSSGLDKEFEMTLRMGSNAHSPSQGSAGGATPSPPDIIAPKPMRVVQPPPVFEDPPDPQERGNNLREQIREGDALRMHLEKETPEVVDQIKDGRPLRKDTDDQIFNISNEQRCWELLSDQ